MELSKFLILVKGLKAVYTSDKFLPDEDSIKIWYALLKDVSYEVLNLAIQKYIMTGVYPPTVADLRRLATEVTQGQQADWGKGWEQVLLAIRKYGMYQINEALDSMDDITRQCVERLGFKEICMSENLANDRANFRMIYEQLAERKKKDAQLPEALTEKINAILLENKKQMGIEDKQI